MTETRAPDQRRYRAGGPMLAATVLLAALQMPQSGTATTAGPAVGSTLLAAAGSVPVSLTVSLNLSGLHPAATKGALECGAIAQTQAWVDSNHDSLADYDHVYHAVLGPAHYYGGKAILEFPVVAGSFSGSLTYTAMLSGGALLDPATRAPFAPNPTVLVACWLQLNGRPATWDQGTGLQVVSSSNLASVNQRPLVIAVAAVGSGTQITTTGQLSAQGLYFRPGPVALVGDLLISGPNAPALALAANGSGPGGGRVGSNGTGASTTPVLTGSAARAGLPPIPTPANTTSAAVSPLAVPAVPALDTTVPVNSTPPPPARTGPGAPGVAGLKSVPAVTGVTANSTNAASHTVLWSCVPHEMSCGGDPGYGNPTFSYEVWEKYPDATTFTQISPPAGVGNPDVCNLDCNPDYSRLATAFSAFVAPQTTFRVVRKDPTGHLLSAYADFVDPAPPQPQQPAGFTATEPKYGQVVLNWQAVPGAIGYRIFVKGSTAPPARATGTTVTYTTIPPGNQTFQIAAEYTPGFLTAGLPEASLLVHGVPPTRSVAYLSKGNGTGSAALATLHVTANNLRMDGGLISIANHYGLISGWDNYSGGPTFQSPVAESRYANVTELGLGRSVGCWQWPNHLGGIAVGFITFCVAGNHGTAGSHELPDTAALVASDRAATSSVAVIVTSPTMGQVFVNLVPDSKAFIPGLDPFDFPRPEWGHGWNVSTTTTLDSEGAKYTPNACLACHGGTVIAGTGKVTGASLLPIDPGLVAFGDQPGSDRAANEESVRALNAMIAGSFPAAAVSDYITGLYNGKVATPGSVAQADYVPSAWSQQAELFRAVVKPDCVMCHLATPAAKSFGSAANFIQNKALIYADVCTAHSMPHAEVPYQRLWTAASPSGNTNVNLAGYMMAILGYNSCP